MISPDPVDRLEDMREQGGYTFPLLMDSDLEVIKAYGILNEESGKVPHPTAVIVDTSGIATYVRVDVDYRVRPPTVEELVPALEAAQ